MARRRLGFWRRFAVGLVKPLMTGLDPAHLARAWSTSRPTGGVIIVANHISHADPFVLAHFVYDAGRWPQFLAKASVFRMPVVGCDAAPGASRSRSSAARVDAARSLDAAGRGASRTAARS